MIGFHRLSTPGHTQSNAKLQSLKHEIYTVFTYRPINAHICYMIFNTYLIYEILSVSVSYHSSTRCASSTTIAFTEA
jgi:hypothetical protein